MKKPSAADVKRLEFRVTKPTPLVLDPTTLNTQDPLTFVSITSDSSLSSVSSSSTVGQRSESLQGAQPSSGVESSVKEGVGIDESETGNLGPREPTRNSKNIPSDNIYSPNDRDDSGSKIDVDSDQTENVNRNESENLIERRNKETDGKEDKEKEHIALESVETRHKHQDTTIQEQGSRLENDDSIESDSKVTTSDMADLSNQKENKILAVNSESSTISAGSTKQDNEKESKENADINKDFELSVDTTVEKRSNISVEDSKRTDTVCSAEIEATAFTFEGEVARAKEGTESLMLAVKPGSASGLKPRSPHRLENS